MKRNEERLKEIERFVKRASVMEEQEQKPQFIEVQEGAA